MIENTINFRKKRDTGAVISDSFEFLKQEYKPLLSLILKYVLPFLILYAIVMVNLQIKVVDNIDFTDQKSLLKNIGPVYSNIFLSSLFALFVQSLLAGTFYSYLETYIEKGKNNFTLDEITPKLFSNGLLALGAGVVAYILVILGVFLCILPGFYLANTYSIVVIISIFEKKGISNAFSRSWQLVNKQWWNTFLINLLGVVIVWLSGFFINLPATLTGAGNEINNISEAAVVNHSVAYWILIGLSSVITSILWVVPYTFLAFQYYNLDEINKEFHPKI